MPSCYKTDYSSKISNLEIKIPDVGGLATKSALTAVENKIPDIWLKEQIITQNLMNPKRNLLIIIMTNILLVQSLINQLQKILLHD